VFVSLSEGVRVLTKKPIVAEDAGLFAEPKPKCPFCRSYDVSTSAKKAATSYWRCGGCGAVWHPDRMPARDADYRR
jgi:transposase-like protein